ncbi:hypothetical protein TEQG_08494 [Trichophyton equinum CBS 127.97]|uniref:Uncharacterized protein n=1 Tax=Trichophyton equinum (strain ATCC MYA-4606 / CBS 127.97) TaxID=559882 RepID=F2Q5Y3_TRIEC|nr:hypothetical protein TEQG_08494 [Trichophyton equinum CBS 127.97]
MSGEGNLASAGNYVNDIAFSCCYTQRHSVADIRYHLRPPTPVSRGAASLSMEN